MNKVQTFLLILASAFLGLLLYVTNPTLQSVMKKNPLKSFNRDVNILLTGDIMLGRTVMTKSLDMNDPSYPFRKVSDRLNEADIVFGNLESPIIEKCPIDYSSLKFCANPRMVEGLTFSGVDIVNLANNHILNYGKEGLEETKKILKMGGGR